MSPAAFPLCGILFLVAFTSASSGIENMLQCQMPKDVNAFFTSKGINDPKSYCDNAIAKLKKECGDKKACEVALEVTYKVKHLIKEVSNKLEKVPCTTTPDITDKVKKKIDEIIDRITNKTGKPDVGTEINPADSCKQVLVDLKKPPGMYWVWVNGKKEHIECKPGDPGTETNPSTCEKILSDPTKPDGTYWIWGTDGKAIQDKCERTTYTSCYEALKTNNDGDYWIKPVGGTLKKEHCVKGKIGTINNPSTCEKILSDPTRPDGTYWIWGTDGKAVQEKCERTTYTSCYEALKTNNDGDYWIKPVGGTLKKEHCVKGKIGTINNPSTCEKILSDPTRPDGTYWIWGTDGKAVQEKCERTTYTSCIEALKTNNDGDYWIKPVGGTLKKEHCVKGKIGTINNPSTCEKILSDPTRPDGMYWIWGTDGKAVQDKCERTTYTSCIEALKTNNDGDYWIKPVGGTLKKEHCVKGKIGTINNPSTCEKILSDPTRPDGMYWIWGTDGKAVQDKCERTTYTSCIEALKTNNDGDYWIKPVGGTLKKEHCVKGKIGTINNPSTCEKILSDPTRPDGTYWIWGTDGKAVQEKCERTTYTSCYEALKTNNDGDYWIKPVGGTLKKEHCVKGKIGTINNPSTCEKILSDPTRPDGMYWIWGTDGKAVQDKCERTTYTSCIEALKTNNDGDYWIKPVGGTLKKEHCVKGKIGTINNPSTCEKILSDPTRPDGTYWIWGTDGKAVQDKCERTTYTSCYEALKTNNDGDYWIKPVGGTLKKEHCVKGKIGTINNPSTCEKILSDPNNPSGMYWILDNAGQRRHKKCTRYKSCSEILRDPANKAGTYSISGADGKVVQVECTREKLPASCDEVFKNATLPNGKYSLNKNGQKVEEECIRTGFKITLFEEPDFGGRSITLYSDAFALWDFPYPYLGDLIQSFEIYEGKWTVCKDACHGNKKPAHGTNRCHTYDVGRYNKDVLVSIKLNNDITCVFKGPW